MSEEIPLDKNKTHNIEVVVDRLVVGADVRARLADSVETALKLGQGLVYVDVVPTAPASPGQRPPARRANRAASDDGLLVFSQQFACPDHGTVLPEIEPRIFSFNSPYGACPTCTGLGFKHEIDADLVLDRDKSLSGRRRAPVGGLDERVLQELLQSLAAHFKVDMKTLSESCRRRSSTPAARGG